MLRFLNILMLILIYQGNLSSQNRGKIVSIENMADLLFLNEQYESAAEKIKEALELLPGSGNMLHNIGYFYLFTDDKKHIAVEYLERAAEMVSADYDPMEVLEMSAPPDALYNLGRAYQAINESGKAREAYNKYLEYLDPNDEFRKVVMTRIASCVASKEFLDNPLQVNFINLGNKLNNEFSNINAVFSGDGNSMAYTVLSNKGTEVFWAVMGDSEWESPVNITNQLRNRYLKTSSLSFNGTKLYLVESILLSTIYSSELVNGKWTRAKKVKKPIFSRYNDTHASVSANDSVLYFSSDRPGGHGGLDIYKATLDKKGKWGNIENLGKGINTEFNESTPFVTNNGKYLFFSSDGHKTMGGYDIFYANLIGEPMVINLGSPINDAGDNLFFHPGTHLHTGYISYHRPEGFGKKDIYRIEIEKKINLITEVSAELADETTMKNNTVQMSIQNMDDSNIVAERKQRMPAGSFSIQIVPGNYKVFLQSEGFKDYSQELKIPLDYRNSSLNLSVQLEPLYTNRVLQVELEEKESITAPETETETDTDIDIDTDTINYLFRRSDCIPVDSNYMDRLYTVQYIALRNPAGIEKFSVIPGSSVFIGEDGFTRFRVGIYTNISDARAARNAIRKQGFPDAFVRYYPISAIYTIQIAAGRENLKPDLFKDLGNVYVIKGSDGIYRYVYKFFDDLNHASDHLTQIKGLGYNNAFIRRILPE